MKQAERIVDNFTKLNERERENIQAKYLKG